MDDAPTIPESFRIELRKHFTNAIIVAGRYTLERAEEVLQKGYADLVAFGRPFVANPDLVSRLKHQQPLAQLDGKTCLVAVSKAIPITLESLNSQSSPIGFAQSSSLYAAIWPSEVK